MRKKLKVVFAAVATIVLIFAVSATMFFLIGSISPKPQAFTPHYLTFQGAESKIYLVSATTSYTTANNDYTTTNGQQVPQGSQLFTINLTIRNDYSSQNPPPSLGTPVAPIDGTAYVRLNFTTYNKKEIINTLNVTPSDFLSSATQTGLVLASGETITTNILLATNNTEINAFTVNLVSVSDSIT